MRNYKKLSLDRKHAKRTKNAKNSDKWEMKLHSRVDFREAQKMILTPLLETAAQLPHITNAAKSVKIDIITITEETYSYFEQDFTNEYFGFEITDHKERRIIIFDLVQQAAQKAIETAQYYIEQRARKEVFIAVMCDATKDEAFAIPHSFVLGVIHATREGVAWSETPQDIFQQTLTIH